MRYRSQPSSFLFHEETSARGDCRAMLNLRSIAAKRSTSALSAIACLLFLSGCEEATPLAATALVYPGVIVAAPVLIAAKDGDIRQPVLVKTSSGAPLTPDFRGAARATYTVDTSTVVCTGKHKLNERTVVFDSTAASGYKKQYKIPLACNQGLKGLAFFAPRTPADDGPVATASVSVGPKNVPLDKFERLGDERFGCYGPFRARGANVDPFSVKCYDAGKPDSRLGDFFSVFAQTGNTKNTDEFTVWIFPPN